MQKSTFPSHIQHKPVYVVPYYELDHLRPTNDTDVQFITLGWSQWNSRELSAKVVRHSGNRWSRQSEELPLTRVVDLTILISLALMNGTDFTEVEAQVFERQNRAINITHGSNRDRAAAAMTLSEDALVKKRLRKLHDILNQMSSNGVI